MIYFIAALLSFDVLLTMYALKSLSLAWHELSRLREHMDRHNARDHKSWVANAAARDRAHSPLRKGASKHTGAQP